MVTNQTFKIHELLNNKNISDAYRMHSGQVIPNTFPLTSLKEYSAVPASISVHYI